MIVKIKKVPAKNTTSPSSQSETPKKETQETAATENMPDRAPWYTVLCRFVILLSIIGLSFLVSSCIILGCVCLLDMCFPGPNLIPWLVSFAQQRPVLTAVIVILAFIAFGLYFLHKLADIYIRQPARGKSR